MTGFLFAIVLMMALMWYLERRANRPQKYRGYVYPDEFDDFGEDMVCKRPPKGWICPLPGNHEGTCAARPTNVPLKFLRRNADGKLERLVSDGHWTGWINAEYPARYWYVWRAIAKARSI